MEKVTIISRTQKVADAEFNKLFDELVPSTGKSKTKAGEILRAMARLGYRYFNDGDMLGVGYGKDTCNAAGRYLEETVHGIDRLIDEIWGVDNDAEYEAGLLNVQNYVIDYILANPQLKEQENDEDFWDWKDDEEDRDDTEDDYEEEEVW